MDYGKITNTANPLEVAYQFPSVPHYLDTQTERVICIRDADYCLTLIRDMCNNMLTRTELYYPEDVERLWSMIALLENTIREVSAEDGELIGAHLKFKMMSGYGLERDINETKD